MALPSNLSYTNVIAQYLSAVGDGPDGDTYPDGVPAQGTVTFTPAAQWVTDATAAPNPVMIAPLPIVCSLDSEGYLIDPQGVRGVWLVAGNDPDLNPTGWTYMVRESLIGLQPRTYPIEVPEGSPVDLATVSPISSSTGVPTTVGPQGTSVTSASVTGGNLILTLSDGTTLDAGPLPAGSGGTGAVDSVNTQTGVVVLDAADVGADPTGTASDAVNTHTGATDPHGDRAYTDSEINALINGAPGLLDTLGEIAAQMATDESAVGALTTAVNARLVAANNLSDLTDKPAARGNLGLGTSATKDVGTSAGTVTAGDDVRIGTVNGVAVTGTPVLGQIPTAISSTAATWQTPASGGGGGGGGTTMVTIPVVGQYAVDPFYFGAKSSNPGNFSTGYGRLLTGPGYTIDRVAVEVSQASAVTTSLKCYADDGTGRPGAVLFTAGVIDFTATGIKEFVVSQSLPAGQVWFKPDNTGNWNSPAKLSHCQQLGLNTGLNTTADRVFGLPTGLMGLQENINPGLMSYVPLVAVRRSA